MAITARRVLVTPAMAAELMTKNINRNLPAIHGRRFAKIILTGNWLEDGNPVRRDPEGYVRDGQSRLMGIIVAGEMLEHFGRQKIAEDFHIPLEQVPERIYCPMLIVDGIEAEAQLVMDTGRKRTFAHFLQIKGIGDAQSVQAITTLYWKWVNGHLATRQAFHAHEPAPHQELWQLYQDNDDDIKAAKRIAATTRRSVKIQTSILAVAWMILSQIDEGDCAEFFAQLRLEHDVLAGSGPALLARFFNGKLARDYDQQEQLALIFKAWNLFRDGKIRELLIWKSGGATREPFPMPR